MTEDKALKRSIRARMAKTGESYTAARRQILKPKEQPSPRPSVDLGKSDETIKSGSGKSWDEWFAILDSWGATDRTHTEMARYLMEDHQVPGWWAQTVAVGYERGRGMRRPYQRTDGRFYVTVSKTLPMGVKALSEEFIDSKKRNRWLEQGTLRTRTSTPGKLARFDFRDGNSRVLVTFESKGRSKATVHIEHERLSDERAVERFRGFWKERLAELAQRAAR